MSEYYAMETYSGKAAHAVIAGDVELVPGPYGTKKNARRVKALCGAVVRFNVREWAAAWNGCSKCERAMDRLRAAHGHHRTRQER